ncbi:MAG TPA: TonB family protein [Vampirovibrionales bacterium]
MLRSSIHSVGISLSIALALTLPWPAIAGVVTLPDGGRCEGELQEGKLSGPAVCTYANGDRYEGEFQEGQPHGRGIYTFADNSRYEGEFSNGQFNGQGVREYSNGDRYEGQFVNGNPEGRGIFAFADGSRYEGEIQDGQLNEGGVWDFTNSTCPSAWTGSSDYDTASEPFGGNMGPMDPGRNSGTPADSLNGSSNGSGSVECRRCGKPTYPRIALHSRWEGVVLLSVDIDPSGDVIDVRLEQSSGHSLLDYSAICTIRSWKFEQSDNGRQNQLVRIPFRLEDS